MTSLKKRSSLLLRFIMKKNRAFQKKDKKRHQQRDESPDYYDYEEPPQYPGPSFHRPRGNNQNNNHQASLEEVEVIYTEVSEDSLFPEDL